MFSSFLFFVTVIFTSVSIPEESLCVVLCEVKSFAILIDDSQ